MIKILHITAHLGGGVGKALSGLVQQPASKEVEHTFVILEEQKNLQFIDLIKNCGCRIIICPVNEHLVELIESSDIVQLKWWNHPATIKTLCRCTLPPMRLLVWSHVSGLFNPKIPSGLIKAAHRLLFTSPCSFQSREVLELPSNAYDRMGVVSSSGGFDELPSPEEGKYDYFSVGYIGSFNFSKLHPRYIDFLSAVTIPEFKVKLIGDVTDETVLAKQCEKSDRPNLLEFRGYTNDIASELASINVLAYLLNPEHYGTTENALLEAMAMGIIPIVMNNPAERLIVDDHITGLIINTPEEFAGAINWLFEYPEKRQKIGRQASRSIRERFTAEKMVESLNSHYTALLSMEKQAISFTSIFGNTPAEWFLSCQGNATKFTENSKIFLSPGTLPDYSLMEQTKGSVFHFLQHFPENSLLQAWGAKISDYILACENT
ncbi:glycosyltransferase family 4 protein [Desulfobacula sp.]|uniref:glycosyltransferase family 4 protein n=1 Tax=Desulfobacula sp. TaxID=2593537 RepID=UPI0026042F23|nr:glycosyltransferase family 4 protein [Desulfobacula sp.]